MEINTSLAETLVNGPEFIADLTRLCDAGLFLQAYAHLGTLMQSTAPEPRLLAARIMSHLGADRRADALVHHVWRAHRDHPGAQVAFLRQRVYRGPYEGLKWLERVPLSSTASTQERAEYMSLRAFHESALRDWSAASACHAEAEALAPEAPWLWVEWAYVCDRHDRHDDAMAAVERAQSLAPSSRAALQFRAHLLSIAGHPEHSMALLAGALTRMEHAGIARDLFALQYEQGLYDQAWLTLDRAEACMPLAEKNQLAWLAGRRADVAMRQGHMDVARQQCTLAGGPFYGPIGERLAAPDVEHGHVHLPVGFTRQHWMTCAPATLTSLARYWNVPVQHLEVAEEICYDGTPYHSERQWAESAGFATAEFTVDWPSARALLDAGIPFTLTTVNTASGHLQAVIGYDLARNTLLIRDPMAPAHTEFEAQSVFESHRSSGPRGMAMVPRDQAARLAALALTEADLWDGFHAVMASLARHVRGEAEQAVAQLREVAPGHRLTLTSERALANYDGDEAAALAATEGLLALFPDDVNLQLSKAASLWLIGGRAEHIEWLAHLAARPEADPHVLLRYADRLAEDQRRLPQAQRMLRRALRRAPFDANVWSQYAALTWQSGHTETALPLYRIAACLQETSEDMATAYFRACHFLGRVEEGVAFLQARHARLGELSWAPAATLFRQLDALERTQEGFAVLDEALVRHGDDGALLAYCADVRLRYGQPDSADALLERTPAPQRRATWMRARALLAEAGGALTEAADFARQACQFEPLNIGHQRLHASLLARTQGRAAAFAWLTTLAQRFARNLAVHVLWSEWCDEDDPASREGILRGIVEAHPGNTWALRELATHLVRQRRYADARPAAEAALQRAPLHAASHATMAYLVLRESSYEAAVPYLKRAVELDVDADYAVSTLVAAAPDLATRREALEFVRGELMRQVTVGDGLLNFQSAADSVMDPEALLAVLRDAQRQRADLWHAWVALGVQLNDMGRADEAVTMLDEAVKRFPLLPRAHLERARACLLLGRHADGLASADAALAINPAWGRAVHMYCDIVVNEGCDFERGEPVIRRALARDGTDADMHALLGWMLEHMKRHDDALVALKASLELDPAPRWVWDTAWRVAEEAGQSAQIEHWLDAMTATHPDSLDRWITCGRQSRDAGKAIAAARHATELDPRSLGAWRVLLDRLLYAERFDDLAQALERMPWQDAAMGMQNAYRARLARARGEYDAARELMTRALATEANDFGLWRELADWFDNDDQHDDYIRAAHELVRLGPNSALAHGYLGHACLKAGQPANAMASLQKSLTLDPAYGFAGAHLFDVAIAEKQLDVAADALEVLARSPMSSAWVSARQVKLSCLRGQGDDALAQFDALLALGEDVADGAFEMAVSALFDANLQGEVGVRIQVALARGVCPVVAALRLVARSPAHDKRGALLRSLRDALSADPGHVLKRALVKHASERSDLRFLRLLVRRYRTALHAHDEGWALVAWAYLKRDQHAEVVRWLSDWDTRPTPPTWALDNLCLAHSARGRLDEVARVAQRAHALDADDIDPWLWLAVERALAGDEVGTAAWLDRLREVEVPDYLDTLYRLLCGFRAASDARNSALAVDDFRCVDRHAPRGARLLRRALRRHLMRHTAGWKKPWRWLQLGGL
ncbi:MAG: tetratricopeptide repeat protein [Rhodocyclaceae bacterium]